MAGNRWIHEHTHLSATNRLRPGCFGPDELKVEHDWLLRANRLDCQPLRLDLEQAAADRAPNIAAESTMAFVPALRGVEPESFSTVTSAQSRPGIQELQ